MAHTDCAPGVGAGIGHMRVLDDQGDPITLTQIPGDTLVIDVFRGHW